MIAGKTKQSGKWNGNVRCACNIGLISKNKFIEQRFVSSHKNKNKNHGTENEIRNFEMKALM